MMQSQNTGGGSGIIKESRKNLKDTGIADTWDGAKK
jgi:hypothetical protein